MTHQVSSRAYYASGIAAFLQEDPRAILGALTSRSEFSVEPGQRDAWVHQITSLQHALLAHRQGTVYLEYAVPRLGRRIDAVVLIDAVVFVVEYKVGAHQFLQSARDQVWDYALDLKNFHQTSHDKKICPVLVSTAASDQSISVFESEDGVLRPINASDAQISAVLEMVLSQCAGGHIDAGQWDAGRYLPTPTIIESAMALYAGHGVAELSRSDAGAKNLNLTTTAVDRVISDCRKHGKKGICFVTGVPGAGKTLAGLNVATKHASPGELHSVFLSGNGPLVAVLREALARDHVQREAVQKRRTTKAVALTRVKAFVQNVHHFRDEYLRDEQAPADHIAIFDEAQRAWNLAQTASFMQRKKQRPGFGQSEPEFLISCMDRHPDWAVIVCLVGGGQEINTGEAGIGEWLRAVRGSFPHWEVHVSAQLGDSEYGTAVLLKEMAAEIYVRENDELHLAVAMRSFRAETVSLLVKQILDLDTDRARKTLLEIGKKYPIVLCRQVGRAKQWLRSQARGSERFGIVVSSHAERLRPHAINVRSPMDPVHWFLDAKDDVRSSFYLEDVATEFHVQGLELDWACVVWDGDFRQSGSGWEHFSFSGSRWKNIRAADRQTFQKNAYRVLLTRARQGMVIVVPEGDANDDTRRSSFYDPTFEYLRGLGLSVLS